MVLTHFPSPQPLRLPPPVFHHFPPAFRLVLYGNPFPLRSLRPRRFAGVNFKRFFGSSPARVNPFGSNKFLSNLSFPPVVEIDLFLMLSG
jgi:hypothetical protein